MKHNRRQFLFGAGGAALALPFLPSLLPRTASAASPARPTNLLWLHTYHGGAWETNMFPNTQLTQTATYTSGHTIGAGALTGTISGGDRVLSPILRAPSSTLTEQLVGKMNVLRGVDIPFYIAHHTGYMGNYARNDGNGSDGVNVQGDPRPTIDQLLGWSSKFYPSLDAVRERVMVIGAGNISWNWSDPGSQSGSIQPQSAYNSSRQLFDKIFAAPETTGRKAIIDNVLAHYQSVRNSNRRLSAIDRRRLDDHIAQVDELERRLNVSSPACANVSEPTDEANNHSGSLEEAIRWGDLMLDVVITAFSCGTSRIAAVDYGAGDATADLAEYYGEWHQGIAHQWFTDNAQQHIANQYKNFFGVMAKVAAKMDTISNGAGGTLLDDSLMVWTQECSASTHDSFSIPIVTFGGAAGSLSTGKLIDYRKQVQSSVVNYGKEPTYMGVLYNQWLATVCQAMGLAPSDFELWGHKGYGVPYVGQAGFGPNYGGHYQSTSSAYFQNASNPLPLWWT